MSDLELQEPPVKAPESAMLPGVSVRNPFGTVGSLDLPPLLDATPRAGLPDSSLPGPLASGQEPIRWVYDFDGATGVARATFNGEVSFTSGGSSTAGVTSFNTRTGAVTLTAADVTGVGGALANNAALTGTPTAPTAAPGTSSTQLATTAFVGQAISATALVSTFNGRSGAVTLTTSDVTTAGGAPANNAALTGTPTAPTATVSDNSSAIATTAFVNNWGAQNTVLSFNGRRGAVSLSLSDITSVGGAPIASPLFTGTPAGPTATPGTNSTQLATTAFVAAAVTAASAGVSSFNSRTGAVTLQAADVTGAGGALLAGPAFTGAPTAPTATAGTNTTQLATTAFVATAISNMAPVVASYNGRTGAVTAQLSDFTSVGGAPLASPTFTGTPAGPTPTAGDSSTRLATTAFVGTALGSYLPLTSGTLSNTLVFSAGQGVQYATGSHRFAWDWDGVSLLAKVDGTATPGAMMPRTGVTDGSSGTAGWIGQYASAINTPGITCNADVTTDIISLTLPAGDWDVEGEGWASPAGTMTNCQFGMNTVSATIPANPGDGVTRCSAGGASPTLYASPLRAVRISSAGSTTVYLSCLPSGVAASGYGMIRARRVR